MHDPGGAKQRQHLRDRLDPFLSEHADNLEIWRRQDWQAARAKSKMVRVLSSVLMAATWRMAARMRRQT